MKKFLFGLILTTIACYFTAAQEGDFLIHSGDKGLYLEHKVAPKQSLYSLGRMFNVHPKFLASYNKVDMSKGLAIGQVLRVPLTDTNFIQKGNIGTPIYYKVGEKEGLLKVSSSNKNVSLDNLRDWNGINDNTVTTGSKLVVGFLVSKELPAVTLSPPSKNASVQKPEVTQEIKKAEPVRTAEVITSKETPKEQPKEQQKDQTKEAQPVFAKQDEKASKSEHGFFSYYFEQQVKKSPVKKDEMVTSGMFKTTSGWVDSKYYLLIDGVQPGTIIKITNPANNKFIYAKVLGEMSSIKLNDGLNIRISSAAVSALDITDPDKFIVKVNY